MSEVSPQPVFLSLAFFRRLTGRIFTLLFCACILGAVIQFVRRDAFPWKGEWGHYIEAKARAENLPLAGREAVREMIRTGSYLLIDARPSSDYRDGHIETALSLPADELDRHPEAMDILTPNDALLIYCSGYECDDSLILARALRRQGFTNLVLYAGGWTEWSGP